MHSIEMRRLGNVLRRNAANGTGVVLNGRFDALCDLIEEHGGSVRAELPARASSIQIADALEGVVHRMPTVMHWDHFEEQIALLKRAKIENIDLSELVA